MVKEKSPVIKVIGVGTAGSIIMEYMIKSHVYEADFILSSTFQGVLDISSASTKILLSSDIRRFNTDSYQVTESVQESIEEINAAIEGSDAVIILAGFGGLTGTLGSYLVAEAAIALGIVTIGVVITPFTYDSRLQRAEAGIAQLKELGEPGNNRLFVFSNDELCSSSNIAADTFDRYKIGDVRVSRFVRDIIDILTENSPADADLLAIDWESEFNSVASNYHPNRGNPNIHTTRDQIS